MINGTTNNFYSYFSIPHASTRHLTPTDGRLVSSPGQTAFGPRLLSFQVLEHGGRISFHAGWVQEGWGWARQDWNGHFKARAQGPKFLYPNLYPKVISKKKGLRLFTVSPWN